MGLVLVWLWIYIAAVQFSLELSVQQFWQVAVVV